MLKEKIEAEVFPFLPIEEDIFEKSKEAVKLGFPKKYEEVNEYFSKYVQSLINSEKVIPATKGYIEHIIGGKIEIIPVITYGFTQVCTEEMIEDGIFALYAKIVVDHIEEVIKQNKIVFLRAGPQLTLLDKEFKTGIVRAKVRYRIAYCNFSKEIV